MNLNLTQRSSPPTVCPWDTQRYCSPPPTPLTPPRKDLPAKLQRQRFTPASNFALVANHDADIGAVLLVEEEKLVDLSAEPRARAHLGAGHGVHDVQAAGVMPSLGAGVARLRIGGGVGHPAFREAAAAAVEVGVVEFADRAVQVLVVHQAGAAEGSSGHA